MSDLHRAIQERGDAFRPDRTPPFKALRDRKRRRDQRRAGALVALSVAGVLGVAVVPSALGSGEGRTPEVDDQAQASADYAYTINWHGNSDAYNEAVAQALSERCLTLPGLSKQGIGFSAPPLYSGLIQGTDNADAFRQCAEEAAPGATVEVLEKSTEKPAQIAYTLRPVLVRPLEPLVAEKIERCLALPGVTGSSVEQSDPPTYGLTVNEPDRGALEDCARDVPLYGLELAGRPEQGDLTLAEMENLRDRISADQKTLEAAGITLTAWGPSASRRLVNVGVASDLVAADKILRERYGNDIYVIADNVAITRARAEDQVAVWHLDENNLPKPKDRSLSAMVSRLGCASGETGKVNQPTVVETDAQVTVTFTVAPLDNPSGFSTCQGNKRVPYEIQLDAPLGDRTVLDGTCTSPPARSTSWCSTARRWPDPPRF